MTSCVGSFEEFVQAHVEDLVRLAHLITWDEVEAEDLVQECLMRAAKRWPKIRGMEHPVGYVRRVLVNLALDGKRRRSQELAELTQAVPILADARATAAFDALGAREELLNALGQLPRQQRTVLGMRYFLDLSEAQTAELLGCSTGTVKSAASRGLTRLRDLIVFTPPASEVCDS
jgi:RNA polymerase sigma-70 factor (sigma-E family)